MTTTDTMTMAGMMTGAIREVASRAVTASVSMTIGNASWTIAAVSWMAPEEAIRLPITEQEAQQRIQLAEDVILFDTPGMLWPKIEHETCGDHLAASGAVGRNAMDEESVALALIATLQRRYPADLARRYALANVEGEDFQVLEAIGRKRGAVRSGGHVDLQKAAEILLTDFRSATIGRITLETPEEWLDIAAEIERRRAIEREQQALRDAERKARRAGGRRPNPLQDEDDDA